MKNKFRNQIIFMLSFVVIVLTSCMTEGDIKEPFKSYQPKEIGDGWQISTPENENINSDELKNIFADFHNDDNLWMVRSMTVIRNGKLIAESYTKDDADRYEKRAIWSCTKQFIGILTGMAIEAGYIESPDDKLDKYFPEECAGHPEKKDITIKNLLMMESGIDYTNWGIGGDDDQILRQNPESYVDFIFEKPMANPPGTNYKYKDCDPHLLSEIIYRQTGKHTDQWADDVLFSKINFTNYDWYRYRNETAIGGFGITATPREMAKFAQFVLDSGNYKGEQLVSKDWIAEMLYPHNNAGDKSFGYMWWSLPEKNVYFMSGSGRQLAFIFPEKNLIVIIISEENTQGKFMLGTFEAFEYAERIANIAE